MLEEILKGIQKLGEAFYLELKKPLGQTKIVLDNQRLFKDNFQ